MNTEQKAKAYDEAVNKLRRFMEQGIDPLITRADVQDFFPELKESEDERVRKAIIHFISHTPTVPKGIIGKKTMLAWLEKQGEQKSINELTPQEAMDVAVAKCFKKSEQNLTNEMKSAEESLGISSEEYNKIVDDCIYGKHTDKIKPKFKVGDWVINKNGTVQQILSYKDCIYKHTNGYSSKMFEDEWRLWDITKDAKDSDVLVHNGITFIFKGIVEGIVKGLCLELSDSILNFGEPEYDKDYCPATKEQRDLLFQKMKEDGYEWDAEKKELKKIYVIDEGKAEMDYCFTKMMNGEKVSSA